MYRAKISQIPGIWNIFPYKGVLNLEKELAFFGGRIKVMGDITFQYYISYIMKIDSD